MPAFVRALPAIAILVLTGCGSTAGNPTRPPATDPRAGSPSPAASVTDTAPSASAAPGLSGKLLLTRSNLLVERNLATGEERTVAEAPGADFVIDPAWSPDGTRIAYAIQITLDPGVGDDYGSDIYLADADGGDATMIVRHETAGDFHRAPVFAPDGKTLYFSRAIIDRSTGSPQPIFDMAALDLATGEVQEAIPAAYGGDISTDGTEFVYVDLSTGGQQVAVVDLATGKKRVLASPDDELNLFSYPHFSPDGSTVVFAASGAAGQVPAARRLPGPLDWLAGLVLGSPAEADGPPWDLFLVGADGTGLRRLTEVYDDQPFPDWDATGENIIYLGITGLVYLSADKNREPVRLYDGLLHAQLDWLP